MDNTTHEPQRPGKDDFLRPLPSPFCDISSRNRPTRTSHEISPRRARIPLFTSSKSAVLGVAIKREYPKWVSLGSFLHVSTLENSLVQERRREGASILVYAFQNQKLSPQGVGRTCICEEVSSTTAKRSFHIVHAQSPFRNFSNGYPSSWSTFRQSSRGTRPSVFNSVQVLRVHRAGRTQPGRTAPAFTAQG